MLDIKTLRGDPDAVRQRLLTKEFEFDVARFNALETERKAVAALLPGPSVLRGALEARLAEYEKAGERR